jgi:hypothetical protein
MTTYAEYHGIILPTQAEVQLGVLYGWAGVEFTGSATYTAAANVRYGTDRGDGVLGTLRVPAASSVLLGILIDATTGTVRLPSAEYVQNGYAYGASDILIGTLLGSVLAVDTGLARDQYRDDWQWTQDIYDAAYVYGSDRNTTGLPTAPGAGVKVRILEPTQNQIAVAASTVGYDSSDRVIEIWSDRLRAHPTDETSQIIRPMPADKIVVDSVTWIIKSANSAVYGWRWVCMCKESALTERP